MEQYKLLTQENTTIEDIELLLKWANESVIYKINTNHDITITEHINWLYSRISNNPLSKAVIFMIESPEGLKVGQVRLEFKRYWGEIDIFIDSRYREKGIASRAIQYIFERFHNKDIKALVVNRNKYSHKLFRRLDPDFVNIGKEVTEYLWLSS